MQTEVVIEGALRSEISKALVCIHAEHYGKGATQVKTFATDDVLVTVFRDVLTPLERTLVGASQLEAVRDMRSAFHAAMGEAFVEAVENLTHRHVEAFLPQIDPAANIAVAVFVLGR
jgi:uncharacterized protein YbcI